MYENDVMGFPVGFEKLLAVCLSCMVLLIFARKQSKSFYSPFFLINCCVLTSGPLAGVLQIERLKEYSWDVISVTMGLYGMIVVGAWLSTRPEKKLRISPVEYLFANVNAHAWRSQLLNAASLASLICVLEFARQLYTCGFSLFDWWQYSLGSRYARPWVMGRLGGADFIVRLWLSVYSLAGPTLSVMLPFMRAKHLLLFLPVWVLTTTMAFLGGSRTSLILMLASVFIALITRLPKNPLIRFAVIPTAVIAIILSCNFVVATRTEGMNKSDRTFFSDFSELLPKTDDNFLRCLQIVEINSEGEQYIDAQEFFASAFGGFIPRYFWPNKPTLEQNYFGNWRLFYTTVSASGELVCMFGLFGAVIGGGLIGFILQKLVQLAFNHAASPLGLALYFYTVFFSYMFLRSVLNFSYFIVPLVLIWMVVYFTRVHKGPSHLRSIVNA